MLVTPEIDPSHHRTVVKMNWTSHKALLRRQGYRYALSVPSKERQGRTGQGTRAARQGASLPSLRDRTTLVPAASACTFSSYGG